MTGYEFLNPSKFEGWLIKKITHRAMATFVFKMKKSSLEMDLLLAHAIFNLRLEDLLESDLSDFTHDILGIINNIDRRHMCFNNCFLPRFSGPDSLDKRVHEKEEVINDIKSYHKEMESEA